MDARPPRPLLPLLFMRGDSVQPFEAALRALCVWQIWKTVTPSAPTTAGVPIPTPSRSSISGITPRIASRFAFRFASSIASCAAPRTAARVFLPVAVSSPQLIGSAPAPPAPLGPVGHTLTGTALDRRYLPDKHLQSRSRMRPPERRLVDAVGQRGGDGYRRAVAALHPGSEATEVGLESQTRRSGEEYTRLSLKKRCTHF